jgi:sugar phosphate isomerase/epimerase
MKIDTPTDLSRREFLAKSGAGLAGAALWLSATEPAMAFPLDGVMGLQSYDVRMFLARDLNGTLKTLAGYGYKALDLVFSVGAGQPTAAEWRQALDAAGMICHNAHFNAPMFEEAVWKQSLANARALGLKEVVCSGGVARNATADDWKKYADLLNVYGARTKQDGLQLGWHNHGEFKPVDGQVPYDILLKNTDPSVVKFQIDVGNMAEAGGDPIAYLTNYPTRYYSMHVKDVKDGHIGIALGEGTQDFKKIFQLAKAANIHNFDVETGAPEAVVMEKLKISADYLKNYPPV